jgi:MFS family permease
VTQVSEPHPGTDSQGLRLYWWGQSTSAFGTVFTAIAVPIIAVVHLGASPGQVGLISAASILPVLLFGLPAGALADRITQPRRALIALDTASALAVGVVALTAANGAVSIGWLVALSAALGCVGILMETLYFIHLRQLTDAGSIGPARARLQAGQYGAGVAGRILAGPTIVLFGPAAALAVDAFSYLLSTTTLLRMRPVPAPEHPDRAVDAGGQVPGGMWAGMRFFGASAFHRTLLVALLVPGAALAGAGALTAPFLLRDVGVPTQLYGLLFAASGLMGLVGSVLAGRLLRGGRDARLISLASFTATMVTGLLLPAAGGPLVVAALCAVFGISLPILFGAIANVALGPVVVADVPVETMGRTVAALQVLGAASGLVGALAGGLLGDWLGVRTAIWTVDVAGLVVLMICLPPAVRAARRLRAGSG